MSIFKSIILCCIVMAGFPAMTFASSPVDVPALHRTRGTQWEGKKVGVLGDSMSDPNIKATTRRYYDYLSELIGIIPYPYAVSGYRWKHLGKLARNMRAEHGDSLDAIFIWAGTNDFNASLPLGTFFTESTDSVNVNGKIVERKKRMHVMSDSTFCGSINKVLSYLKHEFPHSSIIILTPIHRGFATFGERNVQPSEEYANAIGLYIDDYVDTLRKAGQIWSVPVIDLFSESGLLPADTAQDIYIADAITDRLHPNDNGQYRIARTAQYRLLGLPD